MGFNSGFKGLMKIPSMGADFFLADGQRVREREYHTDRQRDVTNLIVPLCNFANAPKNHRNLND